MKKIDNPLEWFKEKFCQKCKNKPCQSKGPVYVTSPPKVEARLLCILALNAMLELNREQVKRLLRKK